MSMDVNFESSRSSTGLAVGLVTEAILVGRLFLLRTRGIRSEGLSSEEER